MAMHEWLHQFNVEADSDDEQISVTLLTITESTITHHQLCVYLYICLNGL